jgi:hypothetical protein
MRRWVQPGRANCIGEIFCRRRYSKSSHVHEMLATRIGPRKTIHMRALAMILVTAAILFGVYEYYLKKMPTTDPGTASTQAISLTGVRSDILQIAQSERQTIALNSKCLSLDELGTADAVAMKRQGRDGYAYRIECSGADFQVIAEHPPAAADSPIRYPTLAVDSLMQVHEIASR